MSDGDDEPEETPEESADEAESTEPAASPEELDSQLDEVEAELEDAETEDDLDEVESQVESIERRVETLPEAEEDDEEDPRGDLEDRIEEVRATIEDRRGPYAEDVAELVTEAAGTVRDTRWTDTGEVEVRAAVEDFLETADETVDQDVGFDGTAPEDLEDHAAALEDAAGAIESAGYDADEDAETIATLLEAAETLQSDLDDAQEWSDLTVVEQLDYQGFYDQLTGKTRKDFPPELSVVRIAESERNAERILLALDNLTSDFMQENCIAALRRLGAPEAFDEMNARAQKRNKEPIKVLGKIGDPRALETLLPYIDGDSDPALQRVTLQTIGEIGDDEATQAVADRLVAEEPEVRTNAARALGLIGDTRAVDPLANLLADDEDDSVRTSAAWALNQIGTEKALETAAEYDDDRSFIVQNEARKARDALGSDEPEPEATA
ncbi:HEAT repeat domain-containing protein [Halomarina litorea]|uniref:HEAT repeat domain-containing protein n=1 Tax=Halomarina litorea TaxID=2961595 RepID=UPI0020C59F64|nr:HEAT repeat domain-containing protein [Halomarina sp. BCD28]